MKKRKNPEDIQCPVCGYYCLGKGGYGCINKPRLCGIEADRQAILDKLCEPSRRYKYEALKGNSVLVSKGLCDCIDESLNLAEEMKGKADA